MEPAGLNMTIHNMSGQEAKDLLLLIACKFYRIGSGKGSGRYTRDDFIEEVDGVFSNLFSQDYSSL